MKTVLIFFGLMIISCNGHNTNKEISNVTLSNSKSRDSVSVDSVRLDNYNMIVDSVFDVMSSLVTESSLFEDFLIKNSSFSIQDFFSVIQTSDKVVLEKESLLNDENIVVVSTKTALEEEFNNKESETYETLMNILFFMSSPYEQYSGKKISIEKKNGDGVFISVFLFGGYELNFQEDFAGHLELNNIVTFHKGGDY